MNYALSYFMTEVNNAVSSQCSFCTKIQTTVGLSYTQITVIKATAR